MNRVARSKGRNAANDRGATDANAAAGRSTGRPWFTITFAFMSRYGVLPSATVGAFFRLACACAQRLSEGVLVGAGSWTTRDGAGVDRCVRCP